MDLARITRHLLATQRQVSRAFPASTLGAIEQVIKSSEAEHRGEIRFVVEGGLDGLPLLTGQSPRQRAIELFSLLGVWDTEDNSGLLIYVLLADHAVEIVADRGINAKVGPQEWSKVCDAIQAAFKQSDYGRGVIGGVQAVTAHLVRHFPADGRSGNELSDRPVVL